MSGPDFTKTGATYSGGHLVEIPEPHVRLWPNPNTKQPVRIAIGRFSGYPHYWASLTEKFNPIWNPTLYGVEWGGELAEKPIGWQEAWDDKKGRGRTFEEECDSESQAKNFIQRTLLKEFPTETHEIRGWKEYLTPKIVHVYKHEGD